MATRKESESAEESVSAVCVNCGAPATVSSDGPTANPVAFCARHAPDNLG